MIKFLDYTDYTISLNSRYKSIPLSSLSSCLPCLFSCQAYQIYSELVLSGDIVILNTREKLESQFLGETGILDF
jgi:hypothetical protein